MSTPAMDARFDLELFVNGDFVRSASAERMEVIDPSTEQSIGSTAQANVDDVDRAVESAWLAFRTGWRLLAPPERSRLLFRFAALIARDAGELAVIEARNTGKPLRHARGDVARAVRYFEYYAGAVDKHLGDTHPIEADSFDFTWREPLGVTAHILPWNFPLPVFARSVGPALATGNTVVAKPAEQAPLTTLLVARLAIEAGIPPGVLNVVTGTGEETGEALVAHPRVRCIAVTGSVETGKRILRLAADRVVPVTPELGGKSPNLVFADAEIEGAAANAYNAIFANSGQTCLAGSRLLVERRVKDRLMDRLSARLREVRLGAGLDDPDLGPLITSEHRTRVEGYIASAREEGASVAAGGGRPAALSKGFFLEPTVLDQVRPSMRAAREEIFGPVLCIFPFDDEDEALALANDTEYGLAAGIFTEDLSRALRLSRQIDAGRIFVNRYPSGDVAIPFGGNRLSGYGRAGGLEALGHFTQVKSVSIHYREVST